MPRLSSEGIDALARELEQEPLRAALLTPKMLFAGAEVVRQGWKRLRKKTSSVARADLSRRSTTPGA